VKGLRTALHMGVGPVVAALVGSGLALCGHSLWPSGAPLPIASRDAHLPVQPACNLRQPGYPESDIASRIAGEASTSRSCTVQSVADAAPAARRPQRRVPGRLSFLSKSFRRLLELTLGPNPREAQVRGLNNNLAFRSWRFDKGNGPASARGRRCAEMKWIRSISRRCQSYTGARWFRRNRRTRDAAARGTSSGCRSTAS
jgi:hypothetical protein